MIKVLDFDDPKCADRSAEDSFYPNEDHYPDGVIPEEAYNEAKMVCFSCKHRSECGDWAIQSNELFGVWGATTPKERHNARRRVRRRALKESRAQLESQLTQ